MWCDEYLQHSLERHLGVGYYNKSGRQLVGVYRVQRKIVVMAVLVVCAQHSSWYMVDAGLAIVPKRYNNQLLKDKQWRAYVDRVNVLKLCCKQTLAQLPFVHVCAP